MGKNLTLREKQFFDTKTQLLGTKTQLTRLKQVQNVLRADTPTHRY